MSKIQRTTDKVLRLLKNRRFTFALTWLIAGLRAALRRAIILGFIRRARPLFAMLTPIGRCFLFTALFALFALVFFHWAELLPLLLFTALSLFAAIFFLLGSHLANIRLEVSETRVSVGQECFAYVRQEENSNRAKNGKNFEIAINGHSYPLIVSKNPGISYEVQIPTMQRGILKVGPVKYVRHDPLNLFRRETLWGEECTVYVYPRTLSFPYGNAGVARDLEGDPEQILVNADLSFHSVREYMRGDERKHIHWKMTAKTGHTVVKQYEETRSSQAALFCETDAFVYKNSEEYELAISVAASIAKHMIARQRSCMIRAEKTSQILRKTDVLEHFAAVGTFEKQEDERKRAHAKSCPSTEVLRSFLQEVNDVRFLWIVTGSQILERELERALASCEETGAVWVFQVVLGAAPALRTRGRVKIATIGALEDMVQIILRERAR